MDYQQPSRTTDFMATVARLMGLIMLIIGLIVGIKVIMEAWALYEEPQRIERFALAIDHGSNLDQLLTSFSKKAISDEGDEAALNMTPQHSNQPTLKISYFIAWAIVLLLLMVIGGIATSAVKTGGQLVLYDLQVKHLTAELIKQVQSNAKPD
jgi:disulfide bond formation protein DsbB